MHGQYELRRLDPQTGTSTLMAALPVQGSFGGAQTADPARGVLCFVGCAFDAGPRLYTVDATNGAVLANPFLLLPRSNGSLRTVAATWAGDAGVAHLADLSPTTGQLASVAIFPADGFPFGSHAFDVAGERAYFIDGQSRLFTLNTPTGAVVSSPTVGSSDAGPYSFGGGCSSSADA